MASIVHIVLVFAPVSFAESLEKKERYFYVVGSGESLGMILRTLGISPKWGVGGAVDRVVMENTQVFSSEKSANLVFPGEKIFFDAIDQKQIDIGIAAGFISRTSHGHIQFLCSKEALSAWEAFRRELAIDVDPYDPRYATLARKCRHTLVGHQRIIASDLEEPINIDSNGAKLIKYESVDLKTRRSGLGLNIGFGFSREDSTDTSNGASATLLSDLTVGYSFDWTQYWSERWQTAFTLSAEQAKYRQVVSGAAQSDEIVLGGFGFSVGYIGSWALWDISIRHQQEPIVRAEQIGDATIDAVAQTFVSGSATKEIVSAGTLSAAGFAGFEYGLGASVGTLYRVQSSSRYFGGILLTQDLVEGLLRLQVKFSEQETLTTISAQRSKDVQAQLGYVFFLP
ncbi:hypothetical protein [Bdellovibrio bacteriovorus]|nr:hypothetical protein [Bdellovibrio bacteriovorus]